MVVYLFIYLLQLFIVQGHYHPIYYVNKQHVKSQTAVML